MGLDGLLGRWQAVRLRVHRQTDAKQPYAGRHPLSLKCDPDRILELRTEYPDAILPGYYSDGRTWISVDLDADLPDDLVLDLCDMSYELVFAKLPKRVQQEI
ncbi:MAG: MmcQ/YjbR family DNA-binding protein [Eggerthellaceae bacterium]|nr:MmcQ/YjbR family DNA-binding protein [Eggerthellaceae bacterium]